MARFWNKTLRAFAAVIAIGMTACSGSRSIPALTSAPTNNAAKYVHQPRFTVIKRQPPTLMQLAFLMTDGSVLAQGYFTPNDWYKYVPDASGSYADGTWTAVASLPAGYAPTAFASAVQADGRLVITGGEYNSPGNYDLQLVNLGAIYNPKTNVWTPIGHPRHWHWIGDSPSSVLPDGRFLVGQKLTDRDSAFDSKTLTWTKYGDVGKADFNAEEGWTLLPDGTILTADVKDAPNSERYNPATGTWVSAGSTIVDLHSPSPYHYCLQYGPKLPKDCYLPPGEIGPAILRPNGTVFATGSGSGTSGFGAGHTAIYTISGSSGSWSVGPDFPNGDNAGDSFGVLEPSGNVIIFGVSGALYEFNGTTFTKVGNSAGPPLLLPTGQIMMLGSTVTLYNPTGSPSPSWAPHIKKWPATVVPGTTYRISGTQFNGLSQAMAFGDEFQNPTNYPLVRITNNATHHVFYARTHDHSSMGVATGSLTVSTKFDVPKTIDTGASTLQVVANGIASTSVSVTVK